MNTAIAYATSGTVPLLLVGFLAHALWRAHRLQRAATPVQRPRNGTIQRMTWPEIAMLPALFATWVSSLGMAAGGVIGAVGLGGVALFYCLAAGPLGWLAGLLVVPLAVYLGAFAGGVVGGLGLLFAAAYGLRLLVQAVV
ncbi:MAG TPA: hypothetical protein VN681_13235 [Stellaceae bacterium]|nr:hypothetical protein [Stellaceae bacterium]